MATFSLRESDKKAFKADGFVQLRGLVDSELIRSLYLTTVYLLKKYNLNLDDHAFRELVGLKPWDSELFNEIMMQFRAEQPKLFGLVYDTVQLSIPIRQLVCDKKLSSTVADLMGDPVEGISATGPMVRMDAPNDTRNALDWHQDSSYYEQNLYGENGVILWIPLHDVSPQNGSMIVCPGSHVEGKVMVRSTGKNELTSSEQFRVPELYVNKYEKHQLVAEPGDIVVMNMDLIHRSGKNTSKQIRFVAGVRYHKMLAEDFLSGKEVFHANQTIGRMSDFKQKQALSVEQTSRI